MRIKPIIATLGILGILAMTNPLYAIDELPLVDQGLTKLALSRKDLNRLLVLNDRIKQIYGAEERLSFDVDEDTGQLFVKFITPEDKTPFTLTFITENGLTQDVRVIPNDLSGRVIRFKPALPLENRNEAFIPPSEEEALIAMLTVLSQGKTPIGYEFTKFLNADRSGPEGIEITPLALYTPNQSPSHLKFSSPGKEVVQPEVRVYLLRNSGKTDITLSEETFVREHDQAIVLLSHTLKPQETTKLIVVSQCKNSPQTQPTNGRNDS